MPGMGELLIILAIVLLIFGAGKLPQIGDALGRSIRNFKRSASGGNELEVGEKKEIQVRSSSPPEEAEIVSPRDNPKQ
ncbi:MAG: twin-arginine translocase TatA/TatE family subunit [Deltaproteobacteria bacterium]|nr:twin-arginine translocase TatA/TatE family subunit [Deltaproteobacteria bacterium]